MMFRLGVQLFPVQSSTVDLAHLRSGKFRLWGSASNLHGVHSTEMHRGTGSVYCAVSFHGSYEAGTGTSWNSMEFHGKQLGCRRELKQNKHFTSYLTSHHQRKATKVKAYQILSDLIRSYQDTVYPVYTCFEATHCVACGRGRYPPRWTWRPAQLCWCWASGWEIFQERPRRSKMFMKSGQVHALSGPFILCHFILFETFDILIFVDSFPIWKAFGLTEFAACGRNRLSSARHQTQLTLRPRRTGRGVRSWITLASGD